VCAYHIDSDDALDGPTSQGCQVVDGAGSEVWFHSAMTGWKKTVNTVLSRLTGYHLERATPKARQGAAGGHGAEQAIRFPDDFDEDYRAIIEAVQPFTMTRNDKLHALITATRYIHEHEIQGSFVECGVWRGGSMHAVARALDAAGDHSRDLYLFDTFEGMPPPTDKDRRVRGRGRFAAEILARSQKNRAVWAYASLEEVQAGFDIVPYPTERIHFVKGKVEDTVPAQAPDEIALLRLDTDWYESTRHELEHLYDRLSSGGVLIIDDYGWWRGSREATDEFLRKTGERLLLVRAGSARIAVKP
jgi:O-methyltransferase